MKGEDNPNGKGVTG